MFIVISLSTSIQAIVARKQLFLILMLIVSLTLVTIFVTPISMLADGGGLILEIDNERDITINGIDINDRSGFGVAHGDINNDGVDDLIIGGRFADPGGRSGAGETYVLFGPLAPGTLELSDADITINGIDPSDISGNRVASGDINNDGKDDLIIGAIASPDG